MSIQFFLCLLTSTVELCTASSNFVHEHARQNYVWFPITARTQCYQNEARSSPPLLFFHPNYEVKSPNFLSVSAQSYHFYNRAGPKLILSSPAVIGARAELYYLLRCSKIYSMVFHSLRLSNCAQHELDPSKCMCLAITKDFACYLHFANEFRTFCKQLKISLYIFIMSHCKI